MRPKNLGPQVTCPKCGRHQPKRTAQPKGGAPIHERDRLYFCDYCRMFYDCEPDEGGDYHDRNPAARLEREERRLENQKRRRDR